MADSRVGNLLYGVGTTSWVAVENGTRLISFGGGELMHGFKDNSETVVHIATVRRLPGLAVPLPPPTEVGDGDAR